MDEYITEDTLKKFNITPKGQDVGSFLADLNDTLEERVGEKITDELDDAQLQALIDLQEKGTEKEVGVWLETNVPDFEHIIKDETNAFLGELAEDTDASIE